MATFSYFDLIDVLTSIRAPLGQKTVSFNTYASVSKPFTFEPTSMDGCSMKNTFIFNFVDGYGEKLQLLRKTFEHSTLNNCVQIYDNLTYARLKQEVDRLRLINFGLFEYVTVIILDNKTQHERFITTKDNVRVLIQTEILTLLKTNKSLFKLPRLFVVQKLEDFGEDDSNDDSNEDENANKTTEVKERVDLIYSDPEYKKLKTIYAGLEYSIYGLERSSNFNESPFIDVFCQEMLENSTRLPMKTIHSNILRIVKRELNHTSIDISFGSNQLHNDDGVLGKGLEQSEERDFFE